MHDTHRYQSAFLLASWSPNLERSSRTNACIGLFKIPTVVVHVRQVSLASVPIEIYRSIQHFDVLRGHCHISRRTDKVFRADVDVSQRQRRQRRHGVFGMRETVVVALSRDVVR